MNLQFQPKDDLDVSLLGRVKWFDHEKGYGFVHIPGQETDYLLHKHVLLHTGRSTICSDAEIVFRAVEGDRGWQVIAVEQIIEPPSATSFEQVGSAVPVRVKWYDRRKGYGFVNEHHGSDDIFVSGAVLKNFGYQSLVTGEALSVTTADDQNGRHVTAVLQW